MTTEPLDPEPDPDTVEPHDGSYYVTQSSLMDTLSPYITRHPKENQ